MDDNVFEILNPDEYECMVRHFEIGHSTMQVQVRHKINRKEIFYLIFKSIEYFSGAIRWNGANFVVKSNEQTISILRRVERLDNKNDEKLLEAPPFRLYEVKTKYDTIQIVARKANKQPNMVK